MNKYDVIVIGGGPGGYVAAIKAAQLGAKVAIVEKHKIGGICLNYGCIPTKTLLRSAKLYKEMLDASSFGIDLSPDASISINWENMMKRKDQVVGKLVSGVEQLVKHNDIDVIEGYGKALDPNHIMVNDVIYECSNLILATGSSTSIPDIPGLRDAYNNGIAIDSTGAISLKEQPDSMTILGGGVIAIEFATLYHSLGTKVTILQRSDKILKMLDADVQKVMERHLKKIGIKIITNVSLEKVEGGSVFYERKGKSESLESEKILISLGRKPNLKGLEALNLDVGPKGVTTGDHMETNRDGVYAIGDLNGRYMLAHVASAEGIIASEAIMGKKTTINYNKVPSCIYSFPEVGVVGLTEEEAREQGHSVETSTFPLSANGKALAEGESTGFVKIISDNTYGEILGVHIVASHATDMIAEAVASMELEGTVHDLAKTVHPHPTLSEIVMEAAHGAVDQPIHAIKKK